MFNKLRLKFSPLTNEQKELLITIQSRKFGIFQEVYHDYSLTIKNNENDNLKTAKKKLLRNMILGTKVIVDENKEWYQYGNLIIVYDKYINDVVKIENRKGKYYFDKSIEQLKRKQWLEKYLGIEV